MFAGALPPFLLKSDDNPDGPLTEEAALGCMDAFGTTDFRDDLATIDVPTLVVHGDSDGIVPFDGSGRRTHDAIDGSEPVLVEGGPHGFNLSHADEFNQALVAFLEK